MIFLLDENFPKRAAAILAEKSHTVFDVREMGPQGLADIEILKTAKQKKAVLLTTDRDFFHTLHLTEKPHHGILVIALKQPNSRSIIEKMVDVLGSADISSFKNRCLLVTDNKRYLF